MAEREYDIGRIPTDVDPSDERLAELEAERLQPTTQSEKKRKLLRCPECGQVGYEGAYPFSTGYYDGRCDDCG